MRLSIITLLNKSSLSWLILLATQFDDPLRLLSDFWLVLNQVLDWIRLWCNQV